MLLADLNQDFIFPSIQAFVFSNLIQCFLPHLVLHCFTRNCVTPICAVWPSIRLRQTWSESDGGFVLVPVLVGFGCVDVF